MTTDTVLLSSLFAALIALTAASPAFAQQSQNEPADSAATLTLKEQTVDILSDVDLGVRLHGSTAKWSHEGPSVLDNAVLLRRSIDATLPATVVYEYGIEVGLRYRRAELMGSFHTNAGILTRTSLQYDVGEEAVAVQPQSRRYVVRGQYLLPVSQRVDVGLGLVYSSRSRYIDQIAQEQPTSLFNVSRGVKELQLVAPAAVDVGAFGIEAHIGGTLWSSHTVTYDLDLVRYPTTLENPSGEEQAFYQFTDGRMQTWTAYLGTRFAAGQAVLRIGATGMITTLPDVFTERRYGLRASLGVPF